MLGLKLNHVSKRGSWCQEQRLWVKCDGTTSDTFPVCNGIKQGGMLSPELFEMYVDILSQQLNKLMVGCYYY